MRKARFAEKRAFRFKVCLFRRRVAGKMSLRSARTEFPLGQRSLLSAIKHPHDKLSESGGARIEQRVPNGSAAAGDKNLMNFV